jgi:GntR family transcriptional regulator, transcriptional repressor for pyruvate dehydrogenase complex
MDADRNKPLSAAVEEQIIAMIQAKGLKPGDRLENEYELAKQLRVGRGTVREAIKGLVSRNILVVRQGSGTFVSPRQGVPSDPLGLVFAKKDKRLALDLLEVRLIVEPEIASLAAVRATDEDIQRIEFQCSKVEKLIKEKKPYHQQDVLFHQYIAQGSQNQVVKTLVPVIYSSTSLNIDLTHNELLENTIRFHRQLVDTIREHDPQGARYAMICHLSENRKTIANNF